jgi:hypothetical protein
LQLNLFGRILEQEFETGLRENKIRKDDLRDLLFKMGYLPFLNNKDHYIVNSEGKCSVVKDVEENERMLESLWLYLNPRDGVFADKQHLYELSKMLLLNLHD